MAVCVHIFVQPIQYGWWNKANETETDLISFTLVLIEYFGASNKGLMMQLEDDHRNSVIKWHNPIEFELVWLVLTRTLVLDGNQSLMMKLEYVYKNSVNNIIPSNLGLQDSS